MGYFRGSVRNQRIAIYALCEPETGEVRYIGQTNNPAGRLYGHISEARSTIHSNPAKHAWVREVVARGLTPRMIILEAVPEPEADVLEQRIIAAYLARGARLLNGLICTPKPRPSQTPPEGRRFFSASRWEELS